MGRPGSTLRVTLPAPAALSSVSLFAEAGGAVAASPAQLAGGDIAVVSAAGTSMGCAVGGGAAAAAYARAGFAARELQCGPGAAGTEVRLSFPRLQARPLSVRVCTRPAELAGMGGALLYVADGSA